MRERQPGYYPRFKTLDQKKYWDTATRKVIEERVANVPLIRYFAADELSLITAICNRLIPQEDRLPEFRIPIVNVIDERLRKNELAGQRYADMPPDREAYALGICAIDQTAREIFQRPFVDLTSLQQDRVLKSIHDGEKLAADEIWQKMSIERFWALLHGDCLTAYYSHPWAWDEIGFGGPAYPRGYMRLENGQPEPWEKEEERYDWQPPVPTLSDQTEDNL